MITPTRSTTSGAVKRPGRRSTPRQAGAEALRRIYSAAIDLSILDSEIGSVAERLADEDVEVVEQATADLEALLLSQEDGRETLAQRCDAALALADILIGQAAMRRSQSKRLQALAQADEIVIERLQEISIKVLRLAHPGQHRISLPTHELKSRKSTSVNINEEEIAPEDLPEDLVRIKREFDRTAIKQFLQAGGTHRGLALEERRCWKVDGHP